MKKLVVSIIAVLCVMVLMVSCTSQPKVEEEEPTTDQTTKEAPEVKEEKPLRFAFSVMSVENPYFIAVINGFEASCKELGIESVIVDAKYDVAKQVSDIENLINQGVDGILISPIDQNAITDLVEQAKEKGIVVMSEAQRVDNAHAIYTLDEYTYGVAIGENASKWINEKLNGEAEVIIISQDNVEPVIQRGNGIQETIEKNCPNAKIVGRQAGDTLEKGMKIVESLVQQNPNVNVIVANNDSGAIGGYEAIMALGLNTEEFYVGGADATAEAISKMQDEGSVYRSTVDILPYDVGYECAEIMKVYKENGLPEEPELYLMSMQPVWQEEVLSGEYPQK